MDKNKKLLKFFKYTLVFISLAYMALYPIYTNYHKGLGLQQYARHIGFLTGDLMFPNPWQYRVFSHWLIEGMYQLYNNTIDKIFNIEELFILKLPGDTSDKFEQTQNLLEQVKTPGFITYNIVFIVLRFVQHILIYCISFFYYKKFIKSDWLVFLGIILISLSIGNSVNDSDLAFNTYFDVIFYLMAGYIIVSGKHDWLIIPISILGALNRETAVLIPFIYFVAKIDWINVDLRKISLQKLLPGSRIIIITAISYLFFWGIFFGLRWYYGMVDYQGVRGAPSGLPTLIINLFSFVSIKTYFEMYGTFMILPLIFIYKFKRVHWILRLLFIAVVPIWFFIHWWAAVAYQSRLYLVPTLLVLIPGVLEIVEQSILKERLKFSQ